MNPRLFILLALVDGPQSAAQIRQTLSEVVSDPLGLIVPARSDGVIEQVPGTQLFRLTTAGHVFLRKSEHIQFVVGQMSRLQSWGVQQ
ncbi:MAG: hypothetical protein Q7R94_02335 [bacterium]|nr:hypothetical protein [bacterium]